MRARRAEKEQERKAEKIQDTGEKSRIADKVKKKKEESKKLRYG